MKRRSIEDRFNKDIFGQLLTIQGTVHPDEGPDIFEEIKFDRPLVVSNLAINRLVVASEGANRARSNGSGPPSFDSTNLENEDDPDHMVVTSLKHEVFDLKNIHGACGSWD